MAPQTGKNKLKIASLVYRTTAQQEAIFFSLASHSNLIKPDFKIYPKTSKDYLFFFNL